MQLLLDECVPRTLIPHLTELSVAHVRDLGWNSLQNGELLEAMRKAGYSVLVTVDRNISFQQPLADYGVAVVVLLVVGNTVEYIVPLIPELRRALPFVQPGQFVRIGPGV